MSEHFVTRFEDYRASTRTVNGLRVAFGIDIDGCVDPGMYKHEPAFAIASLYHYGLQMITPMAMRAWMYVNCYSMDRGKSRFVTLCGWADILRKTPAVQSIGVNIPEFNYLRRWNEITSSLSPEALEAYVEAGDFSAIASDSDSARLAKAELESVIRWSQKVNELVPEATENLTAFPSAVAAIRRAHELGVEICAVSGTPEKHVIKQLRHYGILDCFSAIFAQQAGKKNAALTTITCGSAPGEVKSPMLGTLAANYDVVVMFGDAPKDYQESQKANHLLSGREDSPVRMFFIEAGHENASWQFFMDKVLDKVVSNEWSPEEERSLVEKGLANLDRVWEPEVMPIDTYRIR